MIKVLFCNPHLDVRGTTNAIYDYARFNESILGNESFIAAPSYTDLTSWPKFRELFGDRVLIYDHQEDLQTFVDQNDIDVVYWLKYGTDDGKQALNARNVVHSVFTSQPHGDRYAAVSKWLGDKYGIPHVSHIVSLPPVIDDYRETLGIPANAIVFGRHGGADSFDDQEIQQAVHDAAARHPDKYFLFMNTEPFCAGLPNIIHLEPVIDPEMKTAFINTCDAMIYGRVRGETFGLAICEFLHQDKPVIANINAPERNHIEIMGDRGIYFENYLELSAILSTFTKSQYSYSVLVEQFSPEKVMQQFNDVFLK